MKRITTAIVLAAVAITASGTAQAVPASQSAEPNASAKASQANRMWAELARPLPEAQRNRLKSVMTVPGVRHELRTAALAQRRLLLQAGQVDTPGLRAISSTLAMVDSDAYAQRVSNALETVDRDYASTSYAAFLSVFALGANPWTVAAGIVVTVAGVGAGVVCAVAPPCSTAQKAFIAADILVGVLTIGSGFYNSTQYVGNGSTGPCSAWVSGPDNVGNGYIQDSGGFSCSYMLQQATVDVWLYRNSTGGSANAYSGAEETCNNCNGKSLSYPDSTYGALPACFRAATVFTAVDDRGNTMYGAPVYSGGRCWDS